MMLKHIYLAGGCFWGTEHFFKQIDGVVETDLDKHPDGYATYPKRCLTSHEKQNSYKNVYHHNQPYRIGP